MAASALAKPANAPPPGAPHPLDFFAELVWLDGRPLLETIEPYRRRIFEDVLYTFEADGSPSRSLALCGRAKKNWKTADLCLAAIYRFLAWPSAAGNDCYILANDEGQAGDDLALVKKLFAANPALARRVHVLSKEIARKDGRGVLAILPARDIAGAHGKTYCFAGFDEIHAYKSHDLFEALAPDPTRRDALVWITSYAGIRHTAGIPLFDFMQAGKRGDDPRMHFTWFAGDFSTDPTLADATPEERANPSMASWGNDGYLDQQRRRLPTHKFRRLHLNLPGAPDGAAFNGDLVMAAIVNGRRRLAYEAGRTYFGFVDMSGGSSDDATLAIAHRDAETKRTVLDTLISQTGGTPFNPRDAVHKFATELKAWGLLRVTGDAYAGETFRRDFEDLGVSYTVSSQSKADLYDAFEPKLNAREIELLDHQKLTEQLLTLVMRNGKIDHVAGDHDDFANATAGAIVIAGGPVEPGILAYYRNLVSAQEDDLPPPPPAGPGAWLAATGASPKSRRPTNIKMTYNLLCPIPHRFGIICGRSGKEFKPDTNGIIYDVSVNDAIPLLKAGFLDVSKEDEYAE
jgi:phage terminase large subunit-like protein